MWQSGLPSDAKERIEQIAGEKGLCVQYDTHFDANNCEVTWWTGPIRYRLDFQPLGESFVVVTFNRDSFPFLPRLLLWAWRNIPLFPSFARISTRSLGEIRGTNLADSCEEKIHEAIAIAT
jgi:hypothetical protein